MVSVLMVFFVMVVFPSVVDFRCVNVSSRLPHQANTAKSAEVLPLEGCRVRYDVGSEELTGTLST